MPRERRRGLGNGQEKEGVSKWAPGHLSQYHGARRPHVGDGCSVGIVAALRSALEVNACLPCAGWDAVTCGDLVVPLATACTSLGNLSHSWETIFTPLSTAKRSGTLGLARDFSLGLVSWGSAVVGGTSFCWAAQPCFGRQPHAPPLLCPLQSAQGNGKMTLATWKKLEYAKANFQYCNGESRLKQCMELLSPT